MPDRPTPASPTPLKTLPKVLLFDVNETLLDLAPVREAVGDLLGDPAAATLWFSMLLHHSLVTTVSGRHADFAEIGVATLQMVARTRERPVTDDEARQALAAMRRMPAHADVAPALRRLRDAGFRLATLTNSGQSGVEAQIGNAGLGDCFERLLSVQTPRKFKPHAEVYRWAVGEMGVDAGDAMLVAAHGWDIAGAGWAGMATTFVARPGQQKFPLADPPTLEVADLGALADALGA